MPLSKSDGTVQTISQPYPYNHFSGRLDRQRNTNSTIQHNATVPDVCFITRFNEWTAVGKTATSIPTFQATEVRKKNRSAVTEIGMIVPEENHETGNCVILNKF